MLVFDVDLDGEWASVGQAAGTVSGPYFELLEHKQGVGWLAGDIVARCRSGSSSLSATTLRVRRSKRSAR